MLDINLHERELDFALRKISLVDPPANERLIDHIGCLNRILDCSTMCEVVCFARTSKELRSRVNDYIQWRYAILLQRWISKPTAFRSILKCTSSVISGSTALAFMLSAPWVTGDLDVYVPFGSIGKLLREYLTNEEGYVVESVHFEAGGYPDDWEISTRVEQVYQLSKIVSGASGESHTVSIDIIESQTEYAIDPILRFHSTAVMNWISADTICMTYPHLTCDHLAIVNQLQYSSAATIGKWKEKYLERGFQFYDSPAEIVERKRPCGIACPLITRSSDDVGCMVYNFTDDHHPPEERTASVTWTPYEDEFGDLVVQCLNDYCPRTLTALRKRAGDISVEGV